MRTGNLISTAILNRTAVNASLDHLHTSVSEYATRYDQEDEAVMAARLEQEQREILETDDIVDYDSGEEQDTQTYDVVQKRAPLATQNNQLPAALTAYKSNATTENDPTQKPARPSQPAKKIVNPYRKKSSRTLSQQSSNVPTVPAGASQTEINWSRPSQPAKPLVNPFPVPSSNIQIQDSVEAKPKPPRKALLMDV